MMLPPKPAAAVPWGSTTALLRLLTRRDRPRTSSAPVSTYSPLDRRPIAIAPRNGKSA